MAWSLKNLVAMGCAGFEDFGDVWGAGGPEGFGAFLIELIKSAWGGDHPMFAWRRSRVSEFVRHVARAEEDVAGLGFVPSVVEEHFDLAFDDDEDLVIVSMNVERRSATGRG